MYLCFQRSLTPFTMSFSPLLFNVGKRRLLFYTVKEALAGGIMRLTGIQAKCLICRLTN